MKISFPAFNFSHHVTFSNYMHSFSTQTYISTGLISSFLHSNLVSSLELVRSELAKMLIELTGCFILCILGFALVDHC